MRILQINKFWYPHGGADVYALWLAQTLHDVGHEVRAFTVANEKNGTTPYLRTEISPVQTAKVQVAGAAKTIGRMVWSFEAEHAMERLLREWKPDVAHVHNIYTQMSPSILPVLKRHGVRVVQTVHDWHLLSANYPLFDRQGLDTNGGWWSVVHRRSVKDSFAASVIAASVHALHHGVVRVYERHIDQLIFTSQFARELFRAHGWSGANGTVIPYVIDLAGADK